MSHNNKKYRKKELEISEIQITNERLTGRAWLALFVAYLHQICLRWQAVSGYQVSR